MIQKRGEKFVVTDKAGTKVLGTHPTREKAAKQLAAIEISKAKHMSENTKRFKAFRSELNESEYKETLTGYPNRGIDTDVGPVNKDLLPKVNAVLTAMSRYTYQHTSEALIKIRTRLNLFMLDFPWTPWMWQSNTVGVFTLPVTMYGRVDGIDALTGGIDFKGTANPTAGLQQFTLSVSVETAEDGLYRVIAKLQPREEAVLPEGVEEDGDAVTEDYQTDARAREMANKIEKHEQKAQSGYAAKMTQSGKAAARGRRQEAKHDAASRRLMKRDQKEQDSPRTYGRGGKLIKRGSRAEVKEEIETIEEMYKVGDTVKVPHKGKMVKGKIVRHDKGGSGKAAQHGGGYVVDVGEYSSITVPSHKVVKEEWKSLKKTKADLNAIRASGKKVSVQHGEGDTLYRVSKAKKSVKEEAEQIDELSKATKDAYVAKRGSQLSSMLSGHKRGKQLTGKQQANAVKGIKQAMGVKEAAEQIDEAGAAKAARLAKAKERAGKDGDVERFERASNLQKRIAKRLHAKKGRAPAMSEALIGGQKRLDVNKNKRLDSQDFAMLRAKKKPMKEYTEMMPSIPLQIPNPTEARADKSGKGKRFHKGAIKSVEEAVAKGKKKPSPRQGAANVIGKQKAIKSRLEKHDMRW